MKNTHIEHPEDSILTGDLSVLDWFIAESNISAKIDGAPAIVWGTNPANGKFFVGTKSVFNKVKIKINHSHEEIDTNHQGKVATILHKCFDNLPFLPGIYQGDFIGFGGKDHYTPNTITYYFDEVIDAEIIIAPHTYYEAKDDLRNAVVKPYEFDLRDTEYTKWVKPDVTLYPNRETINNSCKFARQIATLCDFVDVKKATRIKKQLNKCIRNEIELDDLLLDAIADDNNCDINVLRLWKLVESIKLEMFDYIERYDDVDCYIGESMCDHEGYVISNEFGTYKVINREVFSFFNFTMEKAW
tara:strand:+ start:877 stop:1779 length:903 start_codon:yes stop_codon:yes gene_type:complete